MELCLLPTGPACFSGPQRSSSGAHAAALEPRPALQGLRSLLPRRSERRGRLCAARAQKQKLMWEALREAVDEEMERDPTVCLFGKLYSCQLEGHQTQSANLP